LSEIDFTVEGDVLIAGNGELYLSGGRHSVLRFAQGEMQINPKSIENLRENMAERREVTTHAGIRYGHIVAPEKYKVVPDGFPIADPVSLADQYLQAGIEFIYPVDELRNEPSGRSHYITDTHWTAQGLICATCIIARVAGIEEADILETHEEMAQSLVPVKDTFFGDLGRKLDPKRGEQRFILRPRHEFTVTENGLQHDYTSPVNDGRLIVVRSSHPRASKRLTIFGDSYLHHALPYLSHLFSQVVFCRTRFFHKEIVQMSRPDVVISQAAERYLSFVYPDHGAPPFLMVPYLLGRSPNFTPETARIIAAALSGDRETDVSIYEKAPG
jgi:hypothetical protein